MKRILPLITLFLISPLFLFAHTEGGTGFMAGLLHPALGIDHLLAMLSVGILSAQIGGKAIWTVPATFVSFMLIGGLSGIGSEEISFVEPAIALSVIILGIAIGFDKKLPVFIVMAFVGFFGFFHGYAHGVEMPTITHPAFYVGGFVLGTVCIHLIGVFIGYYGTKTDQRKTLLRYTGVFAAGMGMHLLVG